jgi:hypothetical protein
MGDFGTFGDETRGWVDVPGTALPTFRLDVQYTRLASALADEGLTTILLKGPAFDQLLFEGARKRDYSDIDLLVEPGSVDRAEGLMERRGFHRAARRPMFTFGWRLGVAVGLLDHSHAGAWIRERDRFTVDLHHTLPLVGTSAQEVWRELVAHRVTITVVGSQVDTIDRAASALLIALHAAHHGPSWRRIRTDLERACELLDLGCWREAKQLADDLRASRAMGIGLGTTAAGRAIAHQLELGTEPTLAYRLIWPVSAWIDRRRTATSGS